MPENSTSGRSNSRKSPPSQIVIYGAGGFAREVVQLVDDLTTKGTAVKCIGFLVDPDFVNSDRVIDLPVLGDFGWLRKNGAVAVMIGIGSPAVKNRIAARVEQVGGQFARLIHPRATVGRTVIVGSGSILCAGAVATTDIRIGAHVQLHVNSTVGHDCILGDCVTIAPGANIGGAANFGEGAFIGAGAVVLPRRRIGDWSIVAAGAVVTADVPSNSTVAGVPAKVIEQRPPGWHLDMMSEQIGRAYANAH